METEVLKEQHYVEELVEIIRSGLPKEELIDRLSDYHDNDIADALTKLTPDERRELYPLIGVERVAEIFAYLDDAEPYLKELPIESAAKIVSEMDSDDAVDVLEEMDATTKHKIVGMLDKEASEDVRLLFSYDEDEIGSRMTTNFIMIHNNLTIRQAMRELIEQAGENDNISTIYVIDDEDKFYGAIDLKDLIIAREYTDLEDLISHSYPYVKDHEKVADCIEQIKDYAEDSIPVLGEKRRVIGVITTDDIVEAVDDAMGDDYAKLGGLTGEEDLHEPLKTSLKKRMPWLIILLFLGMGVSSVVGLFEAVVSQVALIVCFQSLILDMAGNVGTQSLAVTIRVLMDEKLTARQKFDLVLKEMRVGFFSGLMLGALALVFIGLYVWLFKGKPLPYALCISGCAGAALVLSMVLSSLVGTVIPIFFKKVHIDPAVASGPLITTVNDLVAVVAYYGLAYLFFFQIFHLV